MMEMLCHARMTFFLQSIVGVSALLSFDAKVVIPSDSCERFKQVSPPGPTERASSKVTPVDN